MMDLCHIHGRGMQKNVKEVELTVLNNYIGAIGSRKGCFLLSHMDYQVDGCTFSEMENM